MSEHTYEIRIKLGNLSDKKSPVAKTDGAGNDKDDDNAITAKDVVSMGRKIVAYTGVKRVADAYINQRVNTVALRTGAVEYEQRLQAVKGEVSHAVSSVAAIGLGAVMGGPAGAAVAAVGVGLSYMMKLIGWEQNAQRLAMEKSLESITMRMQQVRTGMSGSRSDRQ